jgi:hypothetical protein
MRLLNLRGCFFFTALFLCATAYSQEKLTYVDLVNRMIDLEHLSVLPAKGETCKQWSSYNRDSVYDEKAGKYVNWSANGDGKGFIRREGEEFVLAEMEGPGCLWRIWSARARTGHVKIYLDGSKTPTVDLPFDKYFTGDTAPFNYPKLSYDLKNSGCSGLNLYFPIPYQKSCKIVAESNWGLYFEFNYTTFPAGTQLPTFSGKPSDEDKAALAKVNAFFGEKMGTDPAGARKGEETLEGETSVAGQAATMPMRIEGPRAITAIRGKLTSPCPNREEEMAALRQLTVEIRFDGQDEPAVCCPLGDFFGTAPGVNLYKSLPLGMTEDGGYSYWYMPFGKKAELRIVNDGDEIRTVSYEVTHAPLTKPMEQLGYFHCKWHRDTVELPKERQPDWMMLLTEGRGRFCGVNLHVWNPRGGWWGEGDEKFFIDGEKFPSTYGTGSEDYFGYAWCHPGLFQEAYHGQTKTDNNAGNQSLHRWQIVDNVPFQKSFEGVIEKYYPNTRPALYACTARWYLAAGGKDPYGPTPVDQRHGYCLPLLTVEGGIKVLEAVSGVAQAQDMSGFGEGKWKDNDQLWWTNIEKSGKLNLAIPVKAKAKYEVFVTLTKAPDYGIFQFYVNNKKAGEPVDLYDENVTVTKPISLGEFVLPIGDQRLTVELVGGNPKAHEPYLFGIDAIEVKKAPK